MEKQVQIEQKPVVAEEKPGGSPSPPTSKGHSDLFGDAKLNKKTVLKRFMSWVKRNMCGEKEMYFGTLSLDFNLIKLAQVEQFSDFKDIGGSKWCVSVDAYGGTLGLHIKCERKSGKVCSDASFTIIVYNPNTVTELGIRGTGFFGGKQLTSEWVCPNFIGMDYFSNSNNGVVDKHGNATVMVRMCVVSNKIKHVISFVL